MRFFDQFNLEQKVVMLTSFAWFIVCFVGLFGDYINQDL